MRGARACVRRNVLAVSAKQIGCDVTLHIDGGGASGRETVNDRTFASIRTSAPGNHHCGRLDPWILVNG